MLQGILFDMDGVLFDTERLQTDIDDIVLANMGYTLPEETKMALYGLNSMAVKSIIMQALGEDFKYDVFLETVQQSLLAEIETNGLPVKPGLEELLEWLRAKRFRMAVASSSPSWVIHSHLRRAGIAAYFDAIVGGEMVANSKPAPDIFIQAAQALSLEPTQCFAVEDSHNGVRSAAAALCVTLMIPDILPPTDEMRGFATVLHSLADVPAFIENYSAASKITPN